LQAGLREGRSRADQRVRTVPLGSHSTRITQDRQRARAAAEHAGCDVAPSCADVQAEECSMNFLILIICLQMFLFVLFVIFNLFFKQGHTFEPSL
jgi:hypothetical protein